MRRLREGEVLDGSEMGMGIVKGKEGRDVDDGYRLLLVVFIDI